MADAVTYRHFQTLEKSGERQQEWAIGLTDDGVIQIRFGVKGKTAKLTVVGPDKCPNGVNAEINLRVHQKLQEGYEEVGHATIKSGRLQSVMPDTTVLTLHWHVHAPLEKELFLNTLDEIAIELGDISGAITEMKPGYGLSVKLNNSKVWDIGYHDEGGILADNRGGGAVKTDIGPIPILILMALDYRLPNHFGFANDEKRIELLVTDDNPYLRSTVMSYQKVREIGERLNLCLSSASLFNFSGNASGKGVWN